MTPAEYFERFGLVAEHDDIERAECTKAGSLGHCFCGVCPVHDKPRFACGCGVLVELAQKDERA